jgi:hypothetical protein
MKTSLGIAVALTALAVLISVPAGAEQFNSTLLGYGGKAGVNVTNVSNHPDNPDNRTTYSIGVLANYPLTRMIDFQMELLIAGRGYTIPNTPVYDTADNLLGTADATAILQYLEIPFLIKLSPAIGKYRPYFIGGGYAAFLVRHKLRLDDGLYQIDFDLNNTNDLDIGGIAGVGIDVKMGRGWFFFEARYEQGAMSVIKDEDYRSHALSFLAGCWF